MILLTHPTGNANVRHAALGLHRAGLLGEFWTGIHLSTPAWAQRLLPDRLCNFLQRRSFPKELRHKIHTQPWREATRLLAKRLGLGPLTESAGGVCSLNAVSHALDRQVARRLSEARFSGVYAYENGAEFAFRSARELNQLAIYERCSGHWRAARLMFEEEASLQPEWAPILTAPVDSASMNERSDTELGLANVVIVPNTFIKRTLEQSAVMRARVAVVPHGVAEHGTPVPFSPRRRTGERLQVLFVGPFSQEKGLSYLFEALRGLERAVELTVIGRLPARSCAVLDRHLAAVRHVQVSTKADLARQMQRHDVLVCPSLFDASSLELSMALAVGLPVIATHHTAAPDLITDNVEGFVIPIRSSAAIAEHLLSLHREPDRLVEMSRACHRRGEECSWERYESTVATRVADAMALSGHGTSASFSQPVAAPQLPGVFPRNAT